MHRVSVARSGSVVHAAAGHRPGVETRSGCHEHRNAARPAADGRPAPGTPALGGRGVSTALAMASLDTAIANIALPAIAADLRSARPTSSGWSTSTRSRWSQAVAAWRARRDVGHQRIYLGGLLLFTLASLGCAFAWSLPSLPVARALQGLGASGLMGVNAALVRFVYPTRMLGRGFGHNALVVGTAFTFGPTIASAILSVGTGRGCSRSTCLRRNRHRDRPEDPAEDAARRSTRSIFPSAALTASCLGLFIIGIGGAAHQAPPRWSSPSSSARLAARLVDDPQGCRPSGADAADRPVPAPDVRAVGGHVGLLVRGAGTGLRRAAVLFEEYCSGAGGDRLLHDAVAAGGRRSWRRSAAGCPTVIRRHPRRPRPGAARHRHGAVATLPPDPAWSTSSGAR